MFPGEGNNSAGQKTVIGINKVLVLKTEVSEELCILPQVLCILLTHLRDRIPAHVFLLNHAQLVVSEDAALTQKQIHEVND